ncbi:MAG: hypothetical protein ACKVS6_16740 [Planctomycetota bacterium]
MIERLTAALTAVLAATLIIFGTVPPLTAQSGSADPQPATIPSNQDRATRPASRPSGDAAPSDDAFKMGSPASLQQGLTEQDMWPAATAELWKKPCLISWQRTFDDAVRVARAKRQPIMVAVNMDGEIASEHYAGVRYREPETAALMSRYSCIVASVYRHTPRDYDPQGARVECPRFQGVTCGEHIEAERELYDKYFEGIRISPRHIVLGLDGKKSYDVYFSWDTATVFTTFRKGVEDWPPPIEQLEMSLPDLVKSANVEDRKRVEREYVEGNKDMKRAILEALVNEPVVDQIEVIRTAIFGLDLELTSLARQALAKCKTDGSLDLMAAALQIPMEESERQLLLKAVSELTPALPRARTLASMHRGLSLSSKLITRDTALSGAGIPTVSSADVDTTAQASAANPKDADAKLAFAEAQLVRAYDSQTRKISTLLLKDARTTAHEAEKLGAKGPRLDAVLAVTAEEFNDLNTARRRAVAAVEGGLLSSDKQSTRLPAVVEERVLRHFADARQRAIRVAFRAGEEWPPEWLSDVNAAYSVLLKGVLAEPQLFIEYLDFLRWIGASSRAKSVLEDGLQRFPDSILLHERLRTQLLWEGGASTLEQAYTSLIARAKASGGDETQLSWFAGYASLIGAEYYCRRAELELALMSYARSINYFERSMEFFSDDRENSLHYIALARAGQARVRLDRNELAQAVNAILQSFNARPDSAATPDGLNITPVATALMLKARLIKAGEKEKENELQLALDALDPQLLETPPSEQTVPAAEGGRNRRRDGGTSRPASRPGR